MKKNIIYTFGVVAIIAIGFGSGVLIANNINKINNSNQKAQVAELIKEPEKTKETTLLFVGDMMLTRGVETSVKNNFNNDFNKLFENISEIKEVDILFGNLEGPVSDTGNNVGSKYSFRMNPMVLPAIKEAGFDIVSFANNHIGDWNMSAFKDTLGRLDEFEIKQTGAGITKQEVEKPTIIEKNGIKFGFLGMSDVGPAWMNAKDDTPGILLASNPQIDQIIQKAKSEVDILIISIHWGEEYKTIHNSRQESLAKMAIDNGADMIIGHHPHVMQDIQIYKDKPIVYSLGNFIFDQHFSKDTMKGMVFEVTFKDLVIIKTENKIVTLNKKYQPEGIFTKEELREKEDIASNVCPKPTKEYDDMWLLPIDQDTKLSDSTYTPSNLRELDTISSTKKGICLIKEARNNFESMVNDAKKEGISIKASSGFRDYNYQKNLLENAKKEGNQNADIAIAKPGHSEHQLGTAVDITGQSIKYISASKSFEKTKEAKWVEENASKYGFIESYGQGKEELTGYMYEPWHYRYVGIDLAKEIIESDKTLNEYLKDR